MGSYRDIHAGSFFRMDLDGIPQQTANDFLPWRARFVPSIAMHMFLHNRFIRRSSEFEAKNTQAQDASPRGSQLDLLRQLRAFVQTLKPSTAVSTWADYYSQTNYDDDTFAKKKELVAAAFAGRRLGTVWDVGANDGTFSRLVSASADRVLALDLDHNAVNAGYLGNRERGDQNIHALVYDVCNPAPALGFENAERSTLEQRSKADVVLALAVIHHLSITNNIPLDQSADYFAGRSKELLIEFVGPGDSQVKRLLAQKNVSYDWYTEQNFQASFSRHFNLEQRMEIPGTDRCFYRFVRPN
jgi:2-polyprenyl-3-methyl-5-hydroxy-6-metoxy-1,4-benzoquinol methylase